MADGGLSRAGAEKAGRRAFSRGATPRPVPGVPLALVRREVPAAKGGRERRPAGPRPDGDGAPCALSIRASGTFRTCSRSTGPLKLGHKTDWFLPVGAA